jgi:hypothetical protein
MSPMISMFSLTVNLSKRVVILGQNAYSAFYFFNIMTAGYVVSQHLSGPTCKRADTFKNLHSCGFAGAVRSKESKDFPS